MKNKTPTGFLPFGAAGYLCDEEVIREYLITASEDPNREVLLQAWDDISRAVILLKEHARFRIASSSVTPAWPRPAYRHKKCPALSETLACRAPLLERASYTIETSYRLVSRESFQLAYRSA